MNISELGSPSNRSFIIHSTNIYGAPPLVSAVVYQEAITVSSTVSLLSPGWHWREGRQMVNDQMHINV